MKLKALVIGATTVALLAIPAVANAAWGQLTGSVNLRTGPSTGYARITTLPAGARVWINGSAGNGWVSVQYGNWSGFVSGRYVAGARIAVPAPMPPPVMHRPPPPHYGYWHQPRWDDRYHAWYDGHRWYRNGVWLSGPGLHFGVTIGN